MRRKLTTVLGERLYLGLYSAVSLGALIWLGLAYAAAPYVEAWPPMPAMQWAPVIVMPFACILVVAGLTSRNPFSLGAGSAGYDAARPGIVSLTRHPVLWGLALWALAHVPPNGDAALLVLFGLFAAAAIAGPPSLDAKRRARMGPDAWSDIAGPTSNVPLRAVLAGRARVDWAGVGAWRLVGGIVLYLLLYLAHAPVIGVAPPGL